MTHFDPERADSYRYTNTRLPVHGDSSLKGTPIQTLGPETKVKLTGYVDAGIAEIKEPCSGWVSSVDLAFYIRVKNTYKVVSENKLLVFKNTGYPQNVPNAGVEIQDSIDSQSLVDLTEPPDRFVGGNKPEHGKPGHVQSGHTYTRAYYTSRTGDKNKVGYVDEGMLLKVP